MLDLLLRLSLPSFLNNRNRPQRNWTMAPEAISRPWSCGLLLLSLLLSARAEMARETVHDDPFVVYPYRLTATSPFGRIPDSALPGSEVPVDTSLPHFHATEGGDFLKLYLVHNGPASDNETTTQTQVAFTPRAPVLPPGVLVDVSGEEGDVARVDEKLAFDVDENLHIVVDHPERFSEVDEIEFWVVAIRQAEGKDDEVVSNPLAFVVTIEHDSRKGEGAAVYVGIVVLAVCLFALLIPLTVRTKRRMREGKPVCACGSSQKKLEEKERKREGATGSGRGALPARQDEIAIIYEGRPRAISEAPEHETFQSKNMRSVSNHHFQPRWLDPHYKDVYEHPLYKAPSPPSPRPATVTVSVHSNGAAASASTSRPGPGRVEEARL